MKNPPAGSLGKNNFLKLLSWLPINRSAQSEEVLVGGKTCPADRKPEPKKVKLQLGRKDAQANKELSEFSAGKVC